MNRPLLVRTALVRTLVLTGLLALPLSGGAGVWAALLGAVCVGLCWRFREQSVNENFWRIIAVCAALTSALGPLLFKVPWGWSGIGLLVFLQVHRARVGRTPADDRVAALFALLMVLLASTQTRAVAMGGVLMVFVLLLPVLLLVLRLEELRGRRPVGEERVWAPERVRLVLAMVSATLVLTVGFFLFIPRLDVRMLAEFGERTVLPGYGGDQVSLGVLGSAKSNDELVMRATVTDASGESLRGPFYFRGAALDVFDGQAWSVSEAVRNRTSTLRPQPEPGQLSRGLLRQDLLVEPLNAAPVFAIPTIGSIFSDESARRDALGSVHLGDAPQSRELVVWSDPGRGGAGFGRVIAGPGLTALPAELDPRVIALAREIAGEGERGVRARRIEAWLRENMRYTLVPSVANAKQPLSAFLFETREGHCEYFATALAVMLRAVDVPSVLALGFYGGDWNEVGGYLAIRQNHAHAWVEAELEPGKWVGMDATPAGEFSDAAGGVGGQLADLLLSRWQRWVIDYDLDRQVSAALAVGAFLSPEASPVGGAPTPPYGAAVVLMLVLGAVFSSLRLRRALAGEGPAQRPGPATTLHDRARRLVARRGWSIPECLPPVEAARWLQERAGDPAAPLEELAWIHYEERYAGRADPGQRDRARACVKALQALPPAPRNSA